MVELLLQAMNIPQTVEPLGEPELTPEHSAHRFKSLGFQLMERHCSLTERSTAYNFGQLTRLVKG
jgi:hypothetical protein